MAGTESASWASDDSACAAVASVAEAAQEVLFFLKNKLLTAGWTVVGSANGSSYEYQGITAGPYDLWVTRANIPLAVDGSNPGWCLLKSPTSAVGTFHLLLAREGTNSFATDQIFMWASDLNFIPHASPVAYLPVVAPGARTTQKRYRRSVASSDTTSRPDRGFFSYNTDDGSFWMAYINTTGHVPIGYMMFSVLDLDSIPPGAESLLPAIIGCGGGGTGRLNYYDDNFGFAIQVPSTQSDLAEFLGQQGYYPVAQLSFPTVWTGAGTYSHLLEDTNYNAVNFEGGHDLIPAYVLMPVQGKFIVPQHPCFAGRVPDIYMAPFSFTECDTLTIESELAYYKCWYWWVPAGDKTPTV